MAGASYPLRAFLRDVAGIVVEEEEPARIVGMVTPLLERFAADGSGLPETLLRGTSSQAAAYLLHEEGDDSFFVIASVLLPGAATGIHYHGVWRAAVVLRGEQEETSYRRADEGSDLTGAELVESGRTHQTAGAISALPDGGFHSAQNGAGEPVVLLTILAGTPEGHAYYRYDADAKALRRAELDLHTRSG
jgi:predicted metal-dependent enzyme (double-stranded beta helix superfamily)